MAVIPFSSGIRVRRPANARAGTKTWSLSNGLIRGRACSSIRSGSLDGRAQPNVISSHMTAGAHWKGALPKPRLGPPSGKYHDGGGAIKITAWSAFAMR